MAGIARTAPKDAAEPKSLRLLSRIYSTYIRQNQMAHLLAPAPQCLNSGKAGVKRLPNRGDLRSGDVRLWRLISLIWGTNMKRRHEAGVWRRCCGRDTTRGQSL
jgi:hypothetical protein